MLKAKALIPQLTFWRKEMDNTKNLQVMSQKWVGRKEFSGRHQCTAKTRSKTYLCNTCEDNQTELAAVKPVLICKEKKLFLVYNPNPMSRRTEGASSKGAVVTLIPQSHRGLGDTTVRTCLPCKHVDFNSVYVKHLQYTLGPQLCEDRSRTGSLRI